MKSVVDLILEKSKSFYMLYSTEMKIDVSLMNWNGLQQTVI